MNFGDFFLDPVLRGPTLGSMLMCLAAGLIGVLVFVQKRSLLGEALSHGTYPGVTGAIVLAGIFGWEGWLPGLILVGAAFSGLLGYLLVDLLERKWRVPNDAALCFVLTFFFGIGIVVASYAQVSHAHLFRQIQAFLYGQAATMSDGHILVYALFALVMIAVVITFYKELLCLSFDRAFAKTSGISTRLTETLFFLLVVLAVVIGIRSVGVVLMCAMLIAPAAAARQFTNRLPTLFFLSALFGMLSGFLGNYLSLSFAVPLPTGPMIVLVAGSFAFLSLLFAPKRGLFVRYLRIARFRAQQVQENLLKTLWRLTQGGKTPLSFSELVKAQGFSKSYLYILLYRLRSKGWVEVTGTGYTLTSRGKQRGAHIIRLHRLWEVYLVNSLGFGVERVHKSAEEMEHILTPELEQKLAELLDHPTQDPHQQPIPTQAEVLSHG